MCDHCNRQGLAALEAIANGEEIPEPPSALDVVSEALAASGTPVHRPAFALPFPVIAFETDSGNVGILTDKNGWHFIQHMLEHLGEQHP